MFVFTQIFLGLHDFIDIQYFDKNQLTMEDLPRVIVVSIEMTLCVIQFIWLLYLSVYFLHMSFEFQKLIQEDSWRVPAVKALMIIMAAMQLLVLFGNLISGPFLLFNDVFKLFKCQSWINQLNMVFSYMGMLAPWTTSFFMLRFSRYLIDCQL